MENNNDNNNDNNTHILNRILTIYYNIIDSNVQAYTQFNNNIRMAENGVRELLLEYRNNNNTIPRYNNNNNTIPRYNNNNTFPRYNNNNTFPTYNTNTYYNRRSNFNNQYINSPNPRNTRNIPPLPQSPNYYNRNVRRSRGNINPFSNMDSPNELFMSFITPNIDVNEEFNNLTPVVVRPLDIHIERISEIIPFRVAQESNNMMCPITQVDFMESDTIVRLRGCGHCFLHEPLNIWFLRSVYCPVCRYDIRSYNSISNDISNNEVEENNMDSTEEEHDEEEDTDLDDIPQSPQLTSSNAINTLINTMTSQLSHTLTEQLLTEDISLNNLDNNGLNLEYMIETPNGGITISAESTSNISELLRNFYTNNNTTNNRSNTTNNNT